MLFQYLLIMVVGCHSSSVFIFLVVTIHTWRCELFPSSDSACGPVSNTIVACVYSYTVFLVSYTLYKHCLLNRDYMQRGPGDGLGLSCFHPTASRNCYNPDILGS